MKKILLYIGIIILSIYQLNAQNFKASVSENPVTEGARFQITFTLEDAQGSGFSPPSFKGFSVLSGPFTSQSSSWINGVVKGSFSYSYVLQAGNSGKFTIGPATINANGKKFQTNSIEVSVLKPSQVQQQQKQQAQSDEKTLGKQANDIIAKNLFVVLTLSKRDCYIGDQIVATYKLYVNPQLSLMNANTPKDLPVGFWAQDIDLGKTEFKHESYNGTVYNVATVRKVVLIPQKSGKIVLSPFELPCTVRLQVQGGNRRRSNDPWSQFFNDPFFSGFNNSYRDFEFKAHSNSITVDVKPLPGNTPASYNGGVGNFTFDAWLDKKQTKTNEPVTLKIKIAGKGNLKVIDNFSLNLPPDLDSYDPKSSDNTTVSEAGINGSKVFEYLLIPRHAGEFKIDPIRWTYFDLQKKAFVTLSSSQFVINVEKGSANESNSQVVSGVNKEDIRYIGKDILYIKSPKGKLSRSDQKFYGSGLFDGILAFPFLLFILFIILFRRRQKENQNQLLLKNRKATKIARKRLSQANKLLLNGNREKYYEELSRALWFYLSDKLSIPISDLSKDNAAIALARLDIPEEYISTILGQIDKCEYARFAPQDGSAEMENLYNDAILIITQLEGKLK